MVLIKTKKKQGERKTSKAHACKACMHAQTHGAGSTTHRPHKKLVSETQARDRQNGTSHKVQAKLENPIFIKYESNDDVIRVTAPT